MKQVLLEKKEKIRNNKPLYAKFHMYLIRLPLVLKRPMIVLWAKMAFFTPPTQHGWRKTVWKI